jgi:hypothetical protein
MGRWLKFAPLLALMALGACASFPTGPSQMSLPGTGKSFDQFRADDAACRQYAYHAVGGVTGEQAAQNAAVGSAIIGTAIGAAAGAAFGGSSGAAVGAGTGLLVGSAAGTGYASGSYYAVQQRYDNAYMQCMYASGNRIPVYGRFTAPTVARPATVAAPPPANYPPPPPPR